MPDTHIYIKKDMQLCLVYEETHKHELRTQ